MPELSLPEAPQRGPRASASLSAQRSSFGFPGFVSIVHQGAQYEVTVESAVQLLPRNLNAFTGISQAVSISIMAIREP